LASTLFRYCLPCCGGKSAPATKADKHETKQHPQHPLATNNSSAQQKQPTTTNMSSHLPHIEEEEEFDPAKQRLSSEQTLQTTVTCTEPISGGELKSALTSLLTPSPKSKQLRVKINEKNKIFLPNTSIEALDTGSGSTSSGSKVQGDRGCMADLQKYQSRYLKNRRHTLANVR
jgi:hypothetical protein